MLSRLAVLLSLVVLAPGGIKAGAPPAVVVSIKPIHALVAGVLAGVAEPDLLLAGAASPHGYGLRPSQASALAQADLVFWVGSGLEGFLARPVAALTADATVVALGEVDGLHLLGTREGGILQGDQAQGAEDGHGHGQIDMHPWLDPRNAHAMVTAIAAALAAADPERAAVYRANAATVEADLAALDADLAARLAPVRDRPFVVFHDAYQYLADRYGLNAVGSITVDPQRRPGAARLRAIRAELAKLDVACVFAEPQFEPALVATLVEGTGARTGVLDPLGADLEAGPDQYGQLLEGLAQSLVACLRPTAPGMDVVQ
jgi:zinc transport system substrate-binding protein